MLVSTAGLQHQDPHPLDGVRCFSLSHPSLPCNVPVELLFFEGDILVLGVEEEEESDSGCLPLCSYMTPQAFPWPTRQIFAYIILTRTEATTEAVSQHSLTLY